MYIICLCVSFFFLLLQRNPWIHKKQRESDNKNINISDPKGRGCSDHKSQPVADHPGQGQYINGSSFHPAQHNIIKQQPDKQTRRKVIIFIAEFFLDKISQMILEKLILIDSPVVSNNLSLYKLIGLIPAYMPETISSHK